MMAAQYPTSKIRKNFWPSAWYFIFSGWLNRETWMPIPLNEPPIHPTASAQKGIFFGYFVSCNTPAKHRLASNTYHCCRHDPVFHGPGSPAHSAIYTHEKTDKGESRQHNDAARHAGRIVTGDGHSSIRPRRLPGYDGSEVKNGRGSEGWEQPQLKTRPPR